MPSNTFVACEEHFHVWKMTRANESTLCQSDCCPFSKLGMISSQICCPWFCGATTQNKKGQASTDADHKSLTTHLSFFLGGGGGGVRAHHKLRTRGYKLVAHVVTGENIL